MNPNPSTIAIIAILDAAQALCEKALKSQGDDWKIHVHAAQCLCDQAKMMLDRDGTGGPDLVTVEKIVSQMRMDGKL